MKSSGLSWPSSRLPNRRSPATRNAYTAMRADHLLGDRDAGDHHVVPHRIHCAHSAPGEAARISPRHSPNPIRAGAGAFAPAAEDHLVAVGEERPPFARRKLHGLRAAPGEFEQAAARALLRPRHGAAAEQVAGPQVAAVARMVREQLADCPVHRLERARRQPDGGDRGRAHRRGAQPHLERDPEPAARTVARIVEVRQAAPDRPRGRANAGVRNGSSASSVTTQGPTVVAKLFARNGPSGWYSQLCMSRADQSFSRHRPKMRSSARAIGTVSPIAFSPQTNAPISSS